MLGLEYHGDAERVDLRHESLRDLRRQPLLHLQPPRVYFHQSRQLREPDDLPIGQIRDMRLAHEGEHVMLAQGIEIQILAQDHFLVVFFAEQRAVDRFLGILRIAAGQELVRLGDAGGSAFEPLAIRVFADLTQDDPDRIFELGTAVSGSTVFFRRYLGPRTICKRSVHLLISLRQWLNWSASSIASEGPPPLMMMNPAASRANDFISARFSRIDMARTSSSLIPAYLSRWLRAPLKSFTRSIR